MCRERYLMNISSQLALLQYRAQNESKLTLQNTNVLAEDFYCALLNCMYGWNLVNANGNVQNVEGIDLIDTCGKLFIQVSATRTATKVKHSLEELKDNPKYKDYRFKFLAITGKADNLRKGTFTAPGGISFDPHSDVMDITSLLSVAKHMNIDKLAELNALVDKELGVLGQTTVFSSGLSYVVSKLSSVCLEDSEVVFDMKEYRIDEKIKLNDIGYWEDIIGDYKIYVKQLRDIYSEYDQLGQNKSLSIQETLKTIYRRSKRKAQGEELFDIVQEEAFDMIRDIEDTNMSEDEVKMYLRIILVDAFIECQIFEKPI